MGHADLTGRFLPGSCSLFPAASLGLLLAHICIPLFSGKGGLACRSFEGSRFGSLYYLGSFAGLEVPLPDSVAFPVRRESHVRFRNDSLRI